MDWAAWGPTIVSIATGLFIAGTMYGNQKEHGKRLDIHDEKFESLDDQLDGVKARIGLGEIELAKLQAWRDGYNAATAANSKHAESL